MRVAITADVHLRGGGEYPERLRALGDILQQLRERSIGSLIVAGDLFDKDLRGYAELESLCRQYTDIALHIIPGNHDPHISDRAVVGVNVHVYESVRVLDFGGIPFVFLPYRRGKRMGEAISDLDTTIPEGWVLVGHGDYYEGPKRPNALEPGTYMPLCRGDLESFRPQTVFLGHIHEPFQKGVVFCPGSPCGLDITETGRRRFLIYDTETGNVTSEHVETDVIYYDEAFMVVPTENALEALSDEAARRIRSWGLEAVPHPEVRVRLTARGYTPDRSKVRGVLRDAFSAFALYSDAEPRIDDLKSGSDPQRDVIAQRTLTRIRGFDWSFGEEDGPTREDVEYEALKAIYGG